METIGFEKLSRKISNLTLLLQANRTQKVLTELTQSQIIFLRIVNIFNSPTIGQLTKAMGSTPSYVSRLASQLEDAEFVKRVHKPEFRKEVFIELANKGINLIGKIEEKENQGRLKNLKLICDSLGVEKIKVIEEVVDYISASMQSKLDK